MTAYKNEYEMQAINFLKKANAKMTISRVEIVDLFPGDDKFTGNRWKYRVRIDRNGKSYQFPFYDSVASYQANNRTSKYDVLTCVEKYEPYGDVWDFASEYGYEIDSKKSYNRVNRIYNACKTQYNKLLALFGEELMEELQEIQ